MNPFLALVVVAGTAQAQQRRLMVLMRVRIRRILQSNLAALIALVRQRSAEALARLAATDQRKLVEGISFRKEQGSASGARLGVVSHGPIGDVVSHRRRARLRSAGTGDRLLSVGEPGPALSVSAATNNEPRINAGLLKALARIGDAQTLDLIKPFRESHQPYVAEAAEIAHDEIEKRLGEPAPATRARPRTVEKAADRP